MISRTKLRCAGDTHPGLVRSNNEDRFHFDSDRGIFLVVDGVGGHAAGEKAADVAVTMLRSRLERETGSAADRIREAIAVANNEIFRLARANPDWSGMACVLTAAVLENGSAVIGHVGDSRLYKIRGGRIQKITHDHSPIGEREDSHDLTETDAMRHPRRNEVYRDVGSGQHAPDDEDFIELIRIPFEDDSALLLCSDGLSDQVTSREIQRTVEENAGDPESAVRRLIAAANNAGGKDNVSVVIVEGPLFSAQRPVAAVPENSRRNPFTSRTAAAGYGFLAGLLLLAAAQWRFGFLDRPRQTVAAPAGPRTLVVGTTEGAQFAAISDALSEARSGDTIELLAGEYREQIRLPKGVSLVSRIPRAAVIRSPANANADDPPVAIVADGVKSGRITGLRIAGEEHMPIREGIVLADSDIEIDDCEISGAWAGIEIRGNSRPVLRANSIRENVYDGVIISGSSAPWLSHNDISRNGRKPRDLRPGIVVLDPARPVFIGNIFSENGAEAVDIPDGMDGRPILKFNFFLKGQALGRTPPGVVGGVPKPARRRP